MALRGAKDLFAANGRPAYVPLGETGHYNGPTRVARRGLTKWGERTQEASDIVATGGVFFSFDGVDGAGKTTQRELFCQWLREAGREVITCRDPGSTALGEKLRHILLEPGDTPIHRRSEMLIYMAARAQMVEEIIRPALAAGQMVVSDRFLLANVVYQGYAGGLNLDDVRAVGRVAVQGIEPALNIVLDMPAEKALGRITRPHDRMESQGLAFSDRVRQGFLAEAALFPDQIAVVAADRPIDVIQAEIRARAATLLK